MRRSTAAAVPFSVRLGGPHPLRFGTGRRWLMEMADKLPRELSPDLKLFASAYAAGFVVVSLFIA